MMSEDRSVQDPSLWMTLLEALEHIRAATNCGYIQAQVWLKNAICNGAIRVKWGAATKRRSPRFLEPILITPARTQDDRRVRDLKYLQGSQLVLAKPGLAFDPESESWIPLQLLRSEVTSTAWPPGGSDATTQDRRDAWMTLVQAVEHIRVLQNFNQIQALQHLKIEIRDRTVPVKWADADRREQPEMCAPQTESDFLLVGAGLALDQDKGTYRPLMCSRSAVQSLWTSAGNESSTSTPPEVAPAKKGRQFIRTIIRMARSVAPSSSAPASEVIAPASNAATTSRPSTGANPNKSGRHSVSIGALCASTKIVAAQRFSLIANILGEWADQHRK